jgi:hypothetical protein
MARLFVTGINLNKNELQNARIHNLSSNPSSPVAGQIYFNTTDNELRYYDGTQWVSGSSVEFGNTASRPAASKAGQLYVDTEEHVIYVDNGSAWVQGTVSPDDVAGLISDHNDLTTGVHGVTGNVVGTSDTQDLSNKRIIDTLYFTDGVTIADEGQIAILSPNHEFEIKANYGDLNLVATQAGADVNITSTNADINLNPDGQVNVDGTVDATSIVTQHVYGSVTGGDLTLSDNANLSQIHINSTTKNIELLPDTGSKAFYGSAATAGNEIAKLSDIQAASSGLSWKRAVNLLDASVTPVLSGDSVTSPLIIDGHDPLGSAESGIYRVLITVGNNAGIYVYNQTGTSWTLDRATDADVYTELIGAAVFVMEGDQYGATSWVQNSHYITDFTGQSWVQFSGQGTYVGSNSIQIDGNEINVIADGTRGLAIDGDGVYAKIGDGIEFDGSGNIAINAGTGLTTASGSLEFASGYGVRKHTTTIGDNSATSFNVDHNFDTRYVTVQVFEATSPYAQVETDVEHTTANRVTIRFASPPGTGSYEVVIVG